jgi:hypothetical protein
VARFILVGRVENRLMSALLASLLRLLCMPEAAALHQSLATTWIPNLVGIEGAMPRFERNALPLARQQAAQISQALQRMDPEAVRPLLSWLAS